MESYLDKGKLGEDIACRFLEEQGCRILERNWRFRHKEIDIIASQGGELLIVEVKLRGKNAYARAVEAVDLKKQEHLIAAANAYVYNKKLKLSVRYDIIGIDISEDNNYHIEYIKEAFYPRMRRKFSQKNAYK